MSEETEFRVWTESSDLVWVGTDYEESETALAEAIADHIAYSECDGCGVLSPHGFSIQVCRGGHDVTGHWYA